MSIHGYGRTLILAPHADDETLGCGATIFRLKQETKSELHWVIASGMTREGNYSEDAISRRALRSPEFLRFTVSNIKKCCHSGLPRSIPSRRSNWSRRLRGCSTD